LAADIDLVVYGVARNITSIQVSKWIEEQGIKVSDCVLLTKYEQARTFSFKVTINANDYEKSQDPSMWPYRVKVRPYRNYNRRSQNTKETEDQRRYPNIKRYSSGTRNTTSANQSMNKSGNQLNSDYDRRNRNIIHDSSSYQRGTIQPIEYDNSGFQVVSNQRKDRRVQFTDDFDIWLRRGSPLESV
jgi:hypothetical protein